MIQFEDLKFEICKNQPDGNSLATISLDNGYQLDIIKKPKTRTYKVKPFELTHGKKRYLQEEFPEYGEFPEFTGRELLVVFLNEIDKIDLSGDKSELDIDIQEED